MTFQTDLLNDAGTYLHTAGFGTYVLDRPYTATDNNPIYWDALGEFDRCTALTLYPLGEPQGTLHEIGLQVRMRGRRNNRVDTKQMSDDADEALDGLERVHWAGVEVVRIWRQSGTNLGPDSNARQEAVRNYYIQYSRATAHRTD